MSKWLVYVAGVVVMVVSAVWYIQHLKGSAFNAGYNEASVAYERRLADMRASIEESNRKIVALREKQIEAYQKALQVRNEQYSEVDRELKIKLDKLEEFENEYAKDWFNTPIPDVYR